MIKVMHVVSELDTCGGVENLLVDLYNNMDRTIFKFDFISFDLGAKTLESRLNKLGSRIYYVPSPTHSLSSYMCTLTTLLNDGDYDILHVHLGAKSYLPLLAGLKVGIRCRITHAHMSIEPSGVFGRIEHLATCIVTKAASTSLMACSERAAVVNFANPKNVQIFHSGINSIKYIFNEKKRIDLRRKYGFAEQFICGHVGRFTPIKNYVFLIRVFKEICNIIPGALLVLVGDGPLRSSVEEMVAAEGLSKSVLFFGAMKDVASCYQIMDCFIFPSFTEGLGMAAIEAQTNGLPVFVSTGVPTEIRFTNGIHFIDLCETEEYWARTIIDNCRESLRVDCSIEAQNAGFDISGQAERLSNFYINTLKA